MTTDINQRVAEIKERAERATKEPWVRFAIRKRIGGAHFIAVGPENLPIILVPTGTLAESQHEALIDATFIANARSDVPFLLAEIEQRDADALVMRDSYREMVHKQQVEIERLRRQTATQIRHCQDKNCEVIVLRELLSEHIDVASIDGAIARKTEEIRQEIVDATGALQR